MFKHIVVAVNESACAKQALELALWLGSDAASQIAICTVIDPMSATWNAGSSANGEQALLAAEDGAKRIVADSLARAREAGAIAKSHVLSGDPAEEIVKFATKSHADAIVMGTHGRTGIKHVVMGSVAESVLRSAPCPVVVVRDAARIPS